MPPIALLAIQIVFSFAAYGVLAKSITPWLRATPRTTALELLLWTHVPRAAPLALLAPGQVIGVSSAVTSTIAWGDFVSAVLALAAIVALRARGERAARWVVLYAIVSGIDIVAALTTGLGNGVQEHALGVGWYILTLYVPLVCVSQGMLVQALLRPRYSAHTTSAARALA